MIESDRQVRSVESSSATTDEVRRPNTGAKWSRILAGRSYTGTHCRWCDRSRGEAINPAWSSMWIEKQHMPTRMDRSSVCHGLGFDRSAMLFSRLSTIVNIVFANISFVVISVYLLYCNRCCLASEPGTGRGWLRSNRQLGSHWSGRAWLQSQR
jgi:hypothetical protein